MELISLLGIIFLLVVGYLLIKAITHSLHLIFYALLIILVIVLVFGISLTQVTDWFLQALLWVL